MKLKWILVISLLLSVKLHARSGVATYSEATDVFEIMDHVSMWHKSLSGVYLNEWNKRFPLSLEDKSYLSKYRKLRLKFHKEVGQGSDIFGKMPIGYDSFSKVFYESASIGEALKKLKKNKVKDSDLKFLQNFYRYFKVKLSSFIKESTRFQVALLDLNKKWREAKISKYLKKLIKFVLGKQGRKVKIVMHPVWYPQGAPPRVDLRGPYLILRYHPLQEGSRWDIISYQESAVLAILNGLPLNERSNLSKIFYQKCRGRTEDFTMTMKTLFAHILPMDFKEKKKFDLYKRWHVLNFVDVYAKLLYPLATSEMKGKGQLSGKFIEQAANLCRQVHDLAYTP